MACRSDNSANWCASNTPSTMPPTMSGDGSAWLGSHQNLAPRPEDNTTTRAASRRVKRLIIADDQQSRIADALARARLRRDNQRRNIDTHGRRTMSTAAGLCWIQSRGYHLGTSGAITRHVSEAEMLDGSLDCRIQNTGPTCAPHALVAEDLRASLKPVCGSRARRRLPTTHCRPAAPRVGCTSIMSLHSGTDQNVGGLSQPAVGVGDGTILLDV